MTADARRPKGQEKDEAGPPVEEMREEKRRRFVNRNLCQASLPDCVHLKDAIEILIQKGYARKYVKEGDRETNEAQMPIDAPTTDDDENRTAV
ncbi:hypothetical protein A2U01_0050950, partial [Trifolium medium]|nr:hypothetical protein [Trifolium medium]